MRCWTTCGRRLETVRWPDQIPNSGWDYGSNLDYLNELVECWRTGFDWRSTGVKRS